MAIDFGKAKVVPKTKSEHRSATVVYRNKQFFARLSSGKEIPLVQNYKQAKCYYAIPVENDRRDPWDKTSNVRDDMNERTLKIISKVWATVKHKQKLKGDIKKDKFIVKY